MYYSVEYNQVFLLSLFIHSRNQWRLPDDYSLSVIRNKNFKTYDFSELLSEQRRREQNRESELSLPTFIPQFSAAVAAVTFSKKTPQQNKKNKGVKFDSQPCAHLIFKTNKTKGAFRLFAIGLSLKKISTIRATLAWRFPLFTQLRLLCVPACSLYRCEHACSCTLCRLEFFSGVMKWSWLCLQVFQEEYSVFFLNQGGSLVAIRHTPLPIRHIW